MKLIKFIKYNPNHIIKIVKKLSINYFPSENSIIKYPNDEKENIKEIVFDFDANIECYLKDWEVFSFQESFDKIVQYRDRGFDWFSINGGIFDFYEYKGFPYSRKIFKTDSEIHFFIKQFFQK